jgi:uncharacterized protein (TIGR03435 family)
MNWVILAMIGISFVASAQQTGPRFEVVSVKPHSTGDNRLMFPQFLPGGRFVATGPLQAVISVAYGLPFNPSQRLRGLPDWTHSRDAIYEIQATGTIPAGLAVKERTDRTKAMLQALLADRFKLVVHHETKPMPVYVLLVDKGGSKLEKADVKEENCPDATPNAASGAANLTCHSFMGGRGRGLHARAADMSDLATVLENWTDRPLVDRTGIKGLYRIDTTPWLAMEPGQPPVPNAKAEDGTNISDLPTIFDVLKRLGLKMESQKATVDVLVVDHIERPAEN